MFRISVAVVTVFVTFLRGSQGMELRGSLRKAMQISLRVETNLSTAWGPGARGSCKNFGCAHNLPDGQICGCYSGCYDIGLCCEDFEETCSNIPTFPKAPVFAPPPRVEEGSCANYQCTSTYVAWHKCQCSPLCEQFGNCCPDYKSVCHKQPPSGGGNCAVYGCTQNYVPKQACQCNDQCHAHGNCCKDYSSQCESAGRCSAYGCSSGFRENQHCQCNAACAEHGNCCSDYNAQCTSHGSCASYGCSSDYFHENSCQCNHKCQEFGNCCADYQDTCGVAPTPAPPSPWDPSNAPMYTFYVYRSQSSAVYPPKNTNAASLAGVTWYLQHEVVTQDPPKFGISRILRYKVQTKAPSALLAKRMNFGVRYAYDSQKCTGPGNCDVMYENYGFFVGCNRFESNYPYPTSETHFRGGIWYSFPGEGNCEGPPTGAANCTYSYTWPPDEISLDELQGEAGRNFWDYKHNVQANQAKVQAVADLFRKKYQNSVELETPACDFDFGRFWK